MHKMKAVKVGFVLLGLAMSMGATGPCDLAAILGLKPVVPATVVVTGAASATTSPIVFTATFDEDVTGLAAAGVTLGGTAHPATVAVAGSGKVFTLSVSGMTAAGTVTVVVNENAVADPGNDASVLVSSNFNPPAPTVAVSAAVVSGATATYTVTYTGADAVTLAAANVTLNKTGTAVGTVAVSGTGLATRAVTISGVAGEGTLSIAIAAGTASNVGVQAAAAAGASFAVDTVPPTVAIGAPSLLLTNVGPVTYAVTYTGATTVTLTAANVTLNKTGTANGTVAVTGTTVTISAITGDGTLGISLAAGTATDSVNLAPAAGPSATFTVDNTAPVISIGIPSVLSTVSGPVTYTVYYNVPTVTLVAANVTLVLTGTANGVVSVAGSGMVRSVTISNITGAGTLGITIAAGTGVDELGNLTAAVTSDTLVSIDSTQPTVTVKPAAGQADPALGGPVHFTALFSEPVTKPAAASVKFTGSAAFTNVATKPQVAITAATSPSASWDISVTGMDVDSSAIVVGLDAGACADAAGNLNTAAANVDNYVSVYDMTPAVKIAAATTVIGAVPSGVDDANGLTFTVDSWDGVNAIPGGDKDLVGTLVGKATSFTVGGTAGANKIGTIALVNQHTWTVKVWSDVAGGFKDGTITLSLAAGTLKDAAGQNNAAGTGTVTRDGTAPTVTIALATGQAAYAKAGPVKFSLTFSKDINVLTFVAGDLRLANLGAVDTITGGPKVYEVTVKMASAVETGAVSLEMLAGKVADAAANVNTASQSPAAKAYVYAVAPSVIGAVKLPNATNTIEIAFDHDMDKTTVENAAAYTFPLSGGTVTATTATQDATDKTLVRVVTNSDPAGVDVLVATSVKDAAGNALAIATQKTLPYYANAPKVVKWTKVSSTVVRATFDHVMAPAGVVVGNFEVTVTDGATADVDAVAIDASQKVVTITQAGAMAVGTFVTAKAAGIVDLAGTALAADDSLLGVVSFTLSGAPFKDVDVVFSRLMDADYMTFQDPITGVFTCFGRVTAAGPPVVTDPVTAVAGAGTTWTVTGAAALNTGAGRCIVKAGQVKSLDGLQTIPVDVQNGVAF